MNKIKKHLFQELYNDDFNPKKSLSYYIKDYNKNIPVRFFDGYDINNVKSKCFRNMDEVFLYTPLIQNAVFVYKYLVYLRNTENKKDITLQHIFRLSLLNESDFEKFPKDDDAFNFAFLDDYSKKAIKTYSKRTLCNLWFGLGVVDLEFRRRIEEVNINSLESSKLVKVNGISFLNDLFDYSKNSNYGRVNSDKLCKIYDYQREIKECENDFISKINLPSDVYFDGHRFTVLMKDEPVDLMFDIDESKTYNIGGNIKKSIENFKIRNHEHYIGGENIKFPTKMSKSVKNRKVSIECGSFENVLDSWDYNIKTIIDGVLNGNIDSEALERYSFILMLKNGGKTKNGIEFSELVDDYKREKYEIKLKYDEYIKTTIQTLTNLVYKHDSSVSFLYKSENGYIVSTYRRNKIKKYQNKLVSHAEFFDNNFNKVGEVENYRHFEVTKYFKSKNSNNLFERMIYETFKQIVNDTSFILYDLEHDSSKQFVKDYHNIIESKKLSINEYSAPLGIINNRYEKIFKANSLDYFAKKLSNQIWEYGYADINNYTESVSLLKSGRLFINKTHSSEKYINIVNDEYELHNVDRYLISYINDNGVKIDTIDFSSFDNIRFNDINYDILDETIEENIKQNYDLSKKVLSIKSSNDFERTMKTKVATDKRS
ncbi:hypothetical protein BPT24_100 [Tenacibaculum phage pT24]|uniref:Uncharacterized protein n=1 Tax=Tenacibaculum phage pT24 TaxID=1880590 RepID=A0A1B4XWQ7_9CAUD|nr:hypothetical protein HYP10_gp100 [Tenacibaculum phage pT24]BAV39225.1 hypothetical protein BPT24_100 [Tenacibaculum phage pT24]